MDSTKTESGRLQSLETFRRESGFAMQVRKNCLDALSTRRYNKDEELTGAQGMQAQNRKGIPTSSHDRL